MGVFPWEVDSVVITLAIWTDNRNCVQNKHNDDISTILNI